MKGKKLSILIPDGESHILIYVVNCLAQVKGVKIYVMSNSKYVAMRYSRHIHHFSYYPKTNSETKWIANINKELSKINIDVVMPIFEGAIRTIIKYKHLITSKTKISLLPSFSNFNTAINKGLLADYLLKHGIPGPKSIVLKPDKYCEINMIDCPVLIKPMEGFGGGKGIRLFKTYEALNAYLKNNKLDSSYLVQEYIEGYDIDCSVLCRNGEILAFTIQKGNLMAESIFIPQVGLEFLYEEKLYAIVEKLMKSLNWSGVAHIDMRYDKNDGQFKVIEVNTRFWRSLEASEIVGVNFPYLYVLASLGVYFKTPKYKCITYLSLKGVVKRIKLSKKFIFQINYLLKQTALKFVLKDPVPIIYKFFSRTKNVILNKYYNN